MGKYVISVLVMFLSCLWIPGNVLAKTVTDNSPFEYETVSEGENTCRITGIRIKKEKGISVLKIPGNINGKTVVSIGKGKAEASYASIYYWNTFLLYNGDSEERWFWDSDIKPYQQREAQQRRVEKIKKIILPDTIREIRDTAFAGLKSLKSIKLSKNLTTIGKCAFGDTSVRKMRLPSNVTAMGKQMFLDSPIKEINIPAKLKVGVPELARTTASWKHFTISRKNPYYKVKNGLLFSKDEKVVYAMVHFKKKISIPDNVEVVWKRSFYNLPMQSLHLGAGVKRIKRAALSTKINCKISISPSNRYLAKAGNCIYYKKSRKIVAGMPKNHILRISRKIKWIGGDGFSVVGIGKKYLAKKLYIPRSVEKIDYGWRKGTKLHRDCKYITERDYWCLYT